MPFSVQALMEQFDIQKIAAVDDIPVGGSYQFKYPTEDDKALIVRLSEDRFVAYNNACTHLSCPVYWDKKREDLVCPCHQGYFDVQTGHPVAGPPQRELPKIELLVENGEIYAVGRKIRHG
jgi:arsenite oxidase small subunit